MRKRIEGLLLACLMLFSAGLIAATYFPPPTLSVFNPTGRVDIAATAASASAVLASNGLSTPTATTAVIHNLSSNVAYVQLSATAASAVATTTGSYPVLGNQSVALALGNARYAAAISPLGASMVISTGN